MNSELTAVILAAGHGTRMKSSEPKVVHALAGRPLLYYSLQAAFDSGASQAVVVTNGHPEIERTIAQLFDAGKVRTVVQDPARGTGDAAQIGIRAVRSQRVLILYGDTPLVRTEDLQLLLASLDAEQADLAVMSCELEQPFGYGRVLRSAEGRVLGIREERDLRTEEERAVCEVNAGMYAARLRPLSRALAEVQPNNAQGEYYLTDVVALIGKASRVVAVKGHPEALLGVNDREQLWKAEQLMLARIRGRHARNGVTIRGDARIDAGVEIGVDAVIEGGVHLRGQTRIGPRAQIDVGSVITDSAVGQAAHIRPYSVITSSRVGDQAQIGPFAHLRPESEIEENAHIGNFVETKKTRIGRGAKANHLSYLGDADVGEGANIGAGTIFCNYDGFQKHRTVIGGGAFIGSDSQLVAPVTVGPNAYVATGTTVTENVPENALAIGRARQENKLDYAPRLRARLSAQTEGKRT